jgi:hypothetical protein
MLTLKPFFFLFFFFSYWIRENLRHLLVDAIVCSQKEDQPIGTMDAWLAVRE